MKPIIYILIVLLLFIVLFNSYLSSRTIKETFISDKHVNTAVVTGLGMVYDTAESGMKSYLGKKKSKKYKEVFKSMRNKVEQYKDSLKK